MFLGLAVRLAVMFMLGRLVFRRVIAMGFWMLVMVAIYLFAASRVHAQEVLEVVWSAPLAPAIEGNPGPAPRGVVLAVERTVRLPAEFPIGAKLYIAASPDGREPFRVDDVLRARFASREGDMFFRFEHDFRRPDRQGTDPYGPLDVTSLLPPGELLVSIEVLDVRPPLFGATPLYLVMLVPRAHDPEVDVGAAVAWDSGTAMPASGLGEEGSSPDARSAPSPSFEEHDRSPISAGTTVASASAPVPVLVVVFFLLLAVGAAARALVARAFWWAAARQAGE